jgi:hypothetical protein
MELLLTYSNSQYNTMAVGDPIIIKIDRVDYTFYVSEVKTAGGEKYVIFRNGSSTGPFAGKIRIN